MDKIFIFFLILFLGFCSWDAVEEKERQSQREQQKEINYRAKVEAAFPFLKRVIELDPIELSQTLEINVWRLEHTLDFQEYFLDGNMHIMFRWMSFNDVRKYGEEYQYRLVEDGIFFDLSCNIPPQESHLRYNDTIFVFKVNQVEWGTAGNEYGDFNTYVTGTCYEIQDMDRDTFNDALALYKKNYQIPDE